ARAVEDVIRPASDRIGQRPLVADGTGNAAEAEGATGQGLRVASGSDVGEQRLAHTGTAKSRRAWLSEVFRSVLALRMPITSAHGTPKLPAGNCLGTLPGMTTLRAGTRPFHSSGALPVTSMMRVLAVGTGVAAPPAPPSTPPPSPPPPPLPRNAPSPPTTP